MNNTKTSFEQLEDAMQIAPAPVLKVVEAVNSAVEVAQREDVSAESLAQEAREIYRSALRKTEDLLEDLTEVAKGSEHPRAYEVANGLIKTMVDTAKMLENSGRQTTEAPGGATQNTQNNLYIGSSEELMRLIRTNNSK